MKRVGFLVSFLHRRQNARREPHGFVATFSGVTSVGMEMNRMGLVALSPRRRQNARRESRGFVATFSGVT